MKAHIIDINVESDYEEFSYKRGHVIKATVRLLGSPQEAQELFYAQQQEGVEIATFIPEAKSRFNIQKGDEVRYRFIRGAAADEPETSAWMSVISVANDMMIVRLKGSKSSFKTSYEFRILTSAVVEHRKSKKWNKAAFTSQERIDLESPCKNDAVTKVYIDDAPGFVSNDPLAELKQQIKDFELT